MEEPVCRLRKALYGLVRSGFDWMQYASDKLLAEGWSVCWEGEQNVYSKTYGKKRMLLVVYVDDFILAGNKHQMKTVWQEIYKLFQMEEPEPLNRFLGVHHQVTIIGKSKRGNNIHKIRMSQAEYCRSIVDKYKEDIGMSKDAKLRYVSTP